MQQILLHEQYAQGYAHGQNEISFREAQNPLEARDLERQISGYFDYQKQACHDWW